MILLEIEIQNEIMIEEEIVLLIKARDIDKDKMM
jgi:hypothetical protein